ncbi:Protein of unknown function [Pyronema omphalodes CBS 100304]|uniref:Uncharacterized protein n=1 Tax=Pyronema omphalodes (strain CBS 100304) TaxID=1076935 RepID=U4KYF8_PYROM|nr:Protein of unknown function [Pyronema omphalodes CBS 100304]
MKTASVFTPFLLSALCSLSTAAVVTPRAEEYTSIILFRDKDYSGPFLTDRYKKSKDSGCIILSDKKELGRFHAKKIQSFKCNHYDCYEGPRIPNLKEEIWKGM